MKSIKKHIKKESPKKQMSTIAPISDRLEWLIEIMRKLLGPDGCPWDKEQSLESLKPFLLEEAFEVLDAIEEGNRAHHAEELGDLFFQIIFQAELAHIPLEQIIRGIGEKLIRRHPHVFGEVDVKNSQEVVANWERIKKAEKPQKTSVLSGVPRSMPALQRSYHLSRKAARVGFEWSTLDAVRAKVAEELLETDETVNQKDPSRMEHEFGDLLFAVVNWARMLGINAEEALRQANRRFENRFAYIEQSLAQAGRTPDESNLAEMDELWNKAKVLEQGKIEDKRS